MKRHYLIRTWEPPLRMAHGPLMQTEIDRLRGLSQSRWMWLSRAMRLAVLLYIALVVWVAMRDAGQAWQDATAEASSPR